MGNVDRETVARVALLARLRLGDDELDGQAKQLASILGYINKLNELDTANTPPTSHALSGLKNVFRKDRLRGSLPVGEALANAPDKDDAFFKVPQVIEGK